MKVSKTVGYWHFYCQCFIITISLFLYGDLKNIALQLLKFYYLLLFYCRGGLIVEEKRQIFIISNFEKKKLIRLLFLNFSFYFFADSKAFGTSLIFFFNVTTRFYTPWNGWMSKTWNLNIFLYEVQSNLFNYS